MKNKTAVVAGGTGGVGEGVVKALLEADYKVIVPTRSEHKIARLREYVADVSLGELIPFLGTVNNEVNAEKLALFLHNEVQHIDLAVASLGGWHQGFPVYAYPLSDWNRILNDNLTSHFLAIKTLVPLLNPKSGFYIHINGFSADEQYPMAGPVSMTAAAQKSLILTLAKELERTGIQVHELILGPMKTRDRLKHGHGQADWYLPEEIGHYIIDLMNQPSYDRNLHYLLSKNKS
ncbi:MAG: SDR family oxidoreductase [Runella zeae]